MLSRPAIFAIGAVSSYMAATGMGILLIAGDINSVGALTTIYIAYSLSVIVALHCCGFGLPLWFEFPLSKRLPKYLEYAYIGLIMVSLIDIINFAPRYYFYLSTKGDETSLLGQINAMAESQLKDNCGKGSQHYSSFRVDTYVNFPSEYCEKLARLVVRNQQKEAVLKNAKDQEFMGQITERVVTNVRGEMDVSEFRNPIAGLIQRLSVLDTFLKYSNDLGTEAVLKWISMLLLPIGIGIRGLKTSLELFADLK